MADCAHVRTGVAPKVAAAPAETAPVRNDCACARRRIHSKPAQSPFMNIVLPRMI